MNSTTQRTYQAGVFGMAGSSVMFAAMAGLLRYAAEVNFYTAALFRFSVGIGLIGLAVMTNRVSLKFSRSRLLFLRGLIGGITTVLFYMAITRIGLAKGTAISFTFPIFATLFGALFLGERITLPRAVAILAAVGGLFLAVQGHEISFSIGLYEGLAMFGAVLAGVVVVLIKKLRETESSVSIFWAQCAVGFWLVLMPAQRGEGSVDILLGLVLVGSGLLAAAGQLLMTYSYRHVPVSTGSLMTMLTPVLNVLVGMLVFGEDVSRISLLGIAMILGSCAVVVSLPAVKTEPRIDANGHE